VKFIYRSEACRIVSENPGMLTGDLSISCFQNTDIVTYEYVYVYVYIYIYIYNFFFFLMDKMHVSMVSIIEMRCHPSQR